MEAVQKNILYEEVTGLMRTLRYTHIINEHFLIPK